MGMKLYWSIAFPILGLQNLDPDFDSPESLDPDQDWVNYGSERLLSVYKYIRLVL
jgi:hypothetical protein